MEPVQCQATVKDPQTGVHRQCLRKGTAVAEGQMPGQVTVRMPSRGKMLVQRSAPLVATPIVMREAIVGTMRDDDFLVIPYHPDQRCTPMSVAGHTLYERLNPYRQPVPGGLIDLHGASFEAHTDRVCRVAGAVWEPAERYTVKLEGSAFVGYRGIAVAPASWNVAPAPYCADGAEPVAKYPSAGFGYGLEASAPKYLMPPPVVAANAASRAGFCS